MQRAFNAGVTRIFVPSIDSTYTKKMYEMEKQYPGNVFLMIGLHPVYVKPDTWEKELDFVETELSKRKFCAVGEIGIDLYWDKTTLAIQQQAFRRQIHLAKKYKIAINIHGRESFDEIFEILSDETADDLFGIFHCFTGSQEQAQIAISLGMKLGIGGVSTFKNGKIDQFLSEIPLEHIVLETDSPYLAPMPFRGKRNESAYIVNIAQKLSEIYDLPLSEIAKITTENSKKVYGI